MEQITVYMGRTVRAIPYGEPMLVSHALEAAGAVFPLPCAGNHTCGKCRVQAYGALSPLTAEEKRLLTVEEQLSNTRLACCAVIVGGCAIHLEAPRGAAVQTSGRPVSRRDPSAFGAEGFALAADIGTTTVAAYLMDLGGGGEPLAVSGLNAQAPFGADVISRVQKASEAGIKPLQSAILSQLDNLFIQLMLTRRIAPKAVKGVSLTGNTVMLHLLDGLDPSAIAVAPYTPQSLFGVMTSARGLFGTLPPATPVYLAPCISTFVGGDITCALLACDLKPGELLIDVGTNGEMALMTGDGLLCCSTAAGPAFEGANLEYGMVAADGAINRVWLDRGAVLCSAIGGASPAGLCGTGAISALAALLDFGAVDETGRLDERYHHAFPLTENVSLTQADIRQLQLAKAAIAAGVDTLLHHSGMDAGQVRALYLAGGFGSYIEPEAAARIGLFPRELARKVSAVGNAAGAGACLCARSESAMDDACRLSQEARTLELATDGFFNERYVEQMLFSDAHGQ